MVTPRYLFNPFEISICGYSNSGKTTLIKKLVNYFSKKFQVGYIKHDAHKFIIDHKGKDTFVISSNGASKVLINDNEHFANIGFSKLDFITQKILMYDMDFVLIEGYKNSDVPKIIFIDKNEEIIEDINKNKFSNIIAIVGKEKKYNKLNNKVKYFHRNDIETISTFILNFFSNRVNKINVSILINNSPQGGTPVSIDSKASFGNRVSSDPAASYGVFNTNKSKYLKKKTELSQLFVSSKILDDTMFNSEYNLFFINSSIKINEIDLLISAFEKFPKCSIVLISETHFLKYKNNLNELLLSRNPFKFANLFFDKKLTLVFSVYQPKFFIRLLQYKGLNLKNMNDILVDTNIEKIIN